MATIDEEGRQSLLEVTDPILFGNPRRGIEMHIMQPWVWSNVSEAKLFGVSSVPGSAMEPKLQVSLIHGP
jgi:hypothetical protein